VRALLPVIVAGATPFVVFALIVTGSGLGLVAWRPPLIWTIEFGSPGPNIQNSITTISADSTGLYTGGFAGYKAYSDFNSSFSYTFVSRYDSGGNMVWTDHLGNPRFSTVKALSAGAEGLYAALRMNSSVVVRKYALNSSPLWTSQFGDIEGSTTISVGTYGVYISGASTPASNGTSNVIMREYDLDGNSVWTVILGNKPGGPSKVLATSTGILVSASDGLGPYDTHAFISKYFLNGTLEWTRNFDNYPGFTCYCAPTGIGEDASGIFVAGNTLSAFPGQGSSGLVDTFLRRFDLKGQELWTIQSGSPDYSGITNSYLSADSSGIYLATATGVGQSFVTKYDPSGNRDWSIQLQVFPRDISVGQNGLYVGGGATSGPGSNGVIAQYGLSSSLVFFGVNPPYSFVIVSVLGGIVVTSLFWLRRRWKKRMHPRSADVMRYGRPRDSRITQVRLLV
jgi:hypothetical protein